MANPAARSAITVPSFSPKAEGKVIDTEKKLGALMVHVVEIVKGTITVGDSLDLKVDGERRRATRANHSATHLLQAALKRVLGSACGAKGFASRARTSALRLQPSQGGDGRRACARRRYGQRRGPAKQRLSRRG